MKLNLSKKYDLLKLRILDIHSRTVLKYDTISFEPRILAYQKLSNLTHEERLFWLNQQIFKPLNLDSELVYIHSRQSIYKNLPNINAFRIINPNYSLDNLFNTLSHFNYCLNLTLIYPIKYFLNDCLIELTCIEIVTQQKETILVCFRDNLYSTSKYRINWLNINYLHCAPNLHGENISDCEEYQDDSSLESEARNPLILREQVDLSYYFELSAAFYNWLCPILNYVYILLFGAMVVGLSFNTILSIQQIATIANILKLILGLDFIAYIYKILFQSDSGEIMLKPLSKTRLAFLSISISLTPLLPV